MIDSNYRTSSPNVVLFVFVSFLLSFNAVASDASKSGKEPWYLDSMNLPFIANLGQVHADVEFYAPILGGAVFVTRTGEIVYSLAALENENKKAFAIKEEILGGRAQNIRGVHKTYTKVACFKGNDPSRWRYDIPTYKEVGLGEVFPGIRLNLKAYGKKVEKVFQVNPGANPMDIRIRLHGVKELRVNEAGQLEAQSNLCNVAFTKPVAYQKIAGKRNYIEVEYLVAGNEYGFSVDHYDCSFALIIDPLLASTYMGGSDTEHMVKLIVDHEGNPYVAGHTASIDFPTTPNAYDEIHNGGDQDLFVFKFNSALSNLESSTFIGGGGEDLSARITFDENHDVYMSGFTTSTDFPTTPGSYCETFNGGDSDFFVLKLDRDLSLLLNSTYIGGSGSENSYQYCDGIAITQSGSVFITGTTRSSDFPTTPNAYDQIINGNDDGFIVRFDSGLTTLEASTFLGGNQDESPRDLILNQAGDVLVTGTTKSTLFPVTQNAYDQTYNGNGDVFITKLDDNLSVILSSTFLGGGGASFFGDTVYCMILDNEENVFINGHATVGFPSTPGAYDESMQGSTDEYIAKLDNDLTTLIASTFLSKPNDLVVAAHELDADENGDIYMALGIIGTNLPVHATAYDQTYNGNPDDGAVAKFDNNLSAWLLGTYLGGSSADSCYLLSLDAWGNVYVAGRTDSVDFPVSLDAYDDDFNGGSFDMILSKLDRDLSSDSLKVLPEFIHASTGDWIDFHLWAGEENAGRTYLVLGSLSGWKPGYLLPGGQAILPLNWDAFTEALLRSINSPNLVHFMGTLNSTGSALATLKSGPIPPPHVGLEIYFAFCLNNPFDFASNPAVIEIVP